MKFYGINELGKYQSGTVDQSSGDAENAFSDTAIIKYESVSQTGSTVTLERKLEFEAEIDTIFILDSNFADLTIYASATSGGAYIDITANATLQLSSDGLHRYYKFATPFLFFDMKFEIVATTPVSQEKEVGAIIGLLEIGEILRFSSIRPTKTYIRKTSKLDSGGIVAMNKGSYWSFKIKTKYVSVQSEVDVAKAVQDINTDLFFWLNGGYDGQEKVKVEPYRFQDLIKCVSTGKAKPTFYKNYLNNVVEDGIDFDQTGAVD